MQASEREHNSNTKIIELALHRNMTLVDHLPNSRMVITRMYLANFSSNVRGKASVSADTEETYYR